MPVLMMGATSTVSTQLYSEEAQEDVYISQEDSEPPPYSETLQENVYLHGVAVADSSCILGTSKRASGGTEEASETASVRTTGPSTFLSQAATAAASLLSLAANTMASSVASAEEDSVRLSLPVKRTFIHYDTSTDADLLSNDDEGEIKRLSKSSSAPAIMLRDTRQAMIELHARGECSPCAYFYHKRDGCRWGEDCKFCHMCPADEIKKRKKQKMKAVKEKRALGHQTASSPSICEAGETHNDE
jgi:hypothetical protein